MPSFQSLPTYAMSPSFSAVTMKANSYQLSGLRNGVSGAMATPSAPVVPRQNVWLSVRTIDTAAPATGAPVSRRVTNTSVFCGLSFTVMPRFVTCTIDARVAASPPVVRRVRASMSPSRTAAHTRPVPAVRAGVTSRPCDCTRSGVTVSRRAMPSPGGARLKLLARCCCSVAMSCAGSSVNAHCVMVRRLRA